MNPYEVLGIAATAQPSEIKSAYRRLAKQHHPDRHGGSDEAAAKFREIQTAYDMLRDDKPKANHDHNQPRHEWFHDMMNQMFRQQHEAQFNVMVHVEISLEMMLTGCSVKIKIPSGEVVDVDLPAGVEHGEQIILEGKGGTIEGTDRTGSLIIMVRQKPHTNFGRQGNTLLSKVEIDVIDMMVGKRVNINMLDGGQKEIVVTPNSNFNTVVVVANEGMPDRHTGIRGNLYVHLVPTFRRLSPEQIEKLREVLDIPTI